MGGRGGTFVLLLEGIAVVVVVVPRWKWSWWPAWGRVATTITYPITNNPTNNNPTHNPTNPNPTHLNPTNHTNPNPTLLPCGARETMMEQVKSV